MNKAINNSSTIPARATWQRALRVAGVLLILLGAGGYLMKRERVSGQIKIGGQNLDQLALKPPASSTAVNPAPPPSIIDEPRVKPVKPTPSPSATPTPVRPIRPIKPIRPILRPTPFPRPAPAEALPGDGPDDGSGKRPDGKSDEKSARPSPPPAPVIPPTPKPTAPPPRPTPTPDEVLYYRIDPNPTPVAPTPPQPLFHQEEVEGDYPGRLEKGSLERVRIRFVRKLVEKPTQTDQTTTNGDRTGIAQSIDPVPGRPLTVPIEESQGTDYQAWIRCRLQSGSIEIIPTESATSPWRPLAKELTLEWEWTIRTTSPSLRQNLEAEMEIEWRPTSKNEKTISRRLWKETLTITVADPLLKSDQLNVVTPLLGGSGALLMLIGALPIRRRKIEPEMRAEKPSDRNVKAIPPAPEPREAPIGAEKAPDVGSKSSVTAPIAAANLDLTASPEQDVVECSVFAPPLAPQGETIMIQVFAHLEDLGAEAARLAIQFDPTARSRGVKTLSSRIARGSELMFHLTLSRTISQPPSTVEIADPIQSLVWMGDTESVQFIVGIPADCRLGNLAGKVTISQETVPIGQISFLLRVVPAGTPVPETSAEPMEPVGAEAHAYRYTFISYASEDRDKVLARVQMLDQMGIKYFQDLLSLDPGQRWEKELYRNIDQCDLFLLFWSAAAKRSDWVQKEVDYAINRKGGNDAAPPEIKPVIIEGPPLIEPPEKLKHLHFNDRLIYFMNRQTRQTP